LPCLLTIAGVAAAADSVIGGIFTAIHPTVAIPATGAEITSAVGTAAAAAMVVEATIVEAEVAIAAAVSRLWNIFLPRQRRWKAGS